ncbi:hypothetical protein LGM89_12985 [Burkholderia sp. AU31624]|uniref:hypothetical protein n=1 Tax=unclassified Burkholderia TaxID=2613784 RepID=UPI001CF47137|nr:MULTISPECIES: hypothetical protein [unclassified Burkholderia]MCA8065071.1 hypothetical protein [Burkholderia sp. AU38729]MCA8254180.1 hypothetical protein [Burkholderia sp. AU31624]
MFDAPRANEFTQGTVFSCAYAENYKEEMVHGLVITARCDVAQAKVQAFSYVPVIPLSSWLFGDGATVVFDRAESDYINSFSDRLEKDGLSRSLLQAHSFSSVYDAHYRKFEGVKNRAAQCEKLKNIIRQLDETRDLQNSRVDRERMRAHFQICRSHVDSVIKELSGNRLSGYYLLRGLETFEDGGPRDFVALLREVHHIPSDIVGDISSGISREQWRDRENLGLICPRFISDGDYALPVAKMKSPWIEHLMQNFALLFSRIGVRDNDLEDVKKSLDAIGVR